MTRPATRTSWLSRLFGGPRQPLRRRPARPGLEALEDRLAPALFTFTVDRITDASGSAAGAGSGGSGDLRFCIAQANAVHGAASDTDQIVFQPSVFGTKQTINLSATPGTLTITDAHQLAIHGPSSTVTVSGDGTNFGVFRINAGSNVTFDHVRITRGNAVAGGGIDNFGTATLTNCTIDHNSAPVVSVGQGGGIFNFGTATLTNCTIDHNFADSTGGGILNHGTATLTNCTIDHNSTNNDGGGIFNLIGTTVTLTNCTIDHNSTGGNGGGGIFNLGTLNLTNALIALNTAAGPGPDIRDTNISSIGTDSHNLIGDGSGSGLTNGMHGDLVGTSAKPIDPKIGPLQDNGGPTQTVALLAGSPAIDAGEDAVLATVRTDQRGQPRKSGAHVDIGAFELQPPPPRRPIPPNHARFRRYG